MRTTITVLQKKGRNSLNELEPIIETSYSHSSAHLTYPNYHVITGVSNRKRYRRVQVKNLMANRRKWGRRLVWSRIPAWGAGDPGFKSRRPHHSMGTYGFHSFLFVNLLICLFYCFYWISYRDVSLGPSS